jgi:predicted signal transduction protein with EAL and GGDEF domain
MNNTLLFKKLSKAGMPVFWQSYAMVLTALVFSLIFITDPHWEHVINGLIATINSIAVISGLLLYKKPLYPWAFLILAIVLIDTSFVLKSLMFFGVNVHSQTPFWIEELGVALIGVFSLCLMLLFEKQYNIRGFTIDFALLLLSIICFTFLVSPNLLDIFINQLDIYLQIQTTHLVLGAALISLMLINYELLNEIMLKDVILALMVVLLSTHFYLEILVRFQAFTNNLLVGKISFSFYQLAGILAIYHIFTENYHFNFSSRKSKKIGLQFLWGASISAILVIPLGVIYRWKFGLPNIDPFFLASASVLLSLIVIWRITILLRNYEQQRQTLKTIAFTDPLTGLPNYLGVRNQITTQNNLLIFCINVEDFKSINDMYNRRFGDKVLISLARRLEKVPDILFAARTNSDNFLAVFQVTKENIHHTFYSLKEELGVWDTISNQRIAVPLTYGASHSTNTNGLEKLVRQAELALHTSRIQHTDFTLYTKENIDNLPVRLQLPRYELREILQQAIDRDFLPVHFQPIYDIKDGSLKAMELLIRVESNVHGLLLPRQFLDQAKSYGLLTGLTRVCVNMVAKHIAQLPDVKININVPPYMLNNPETLNEFINDFYRVDLSPTRFCIEVTEDGDIPTEHLIPAIELLKTHGFTISMDDFGTGYSSLGRLSVLPVDSVKIDRSLLLTASNGNKAILESAITLVKRLGVSAVVEGVETLEQLNLVRSLGADSVQGFLFSKPVHAHVAAKFSLNASDIVTEF